MSGDHAKSNLANDSFYCEDTLSEPTVLARGKGWILSVHLVNPSDNSFGTAVITPRWLFVLAAATPQIAGDPILIDESLEQIVPGEHHSGRYCRHQCLHAEMPFVDMRSAGWHVSAARG